MSENLMPVFQAIDQLYDEILDDAHWTKALRALQQALGCACLCVAIRDEHTGHTVQHTSRGVVTAAGDRLVPACSVDPGIKIDSRNEHLESLQHYHWHCEPGRCSFCLGAPLVVSEGVSAVTAAHWPRSGNHAQIENRKILHILLPHIARALLIDYRQTRLRSQAAGSAFLMDRVTQAIMIVDGQGWLIRTNDKAQQILSRADGLTVVEGRLKAVDTDKTDALQTLVAAAIKTGHSKNGSRVSIPRPSGNRAYAVSIEPLLAADAIPVCGQSAALIIVSDLDGSQLLPWRALADIFKLTRNEARLAARLAAGESLIEAASELNIAYRTAALHLEHLMHKTGTHRQSDLLRLLLLSPAALMDQSDIRAPHD